MKKIFLLVMIPFFNFTGMAHAKENISSDSPSPHSPYLSYDTSREEVGVGYRYKHHIFMYDIHGSYKFLKYSWTDGHLVNLSFHLLSIAQETPSWCSYAGVGIRGEFYSLVNASSCKSERIVLSPSFCWGYAFKRTEGASPFAELYFIPTRFYSHSHDHINKIGLKLGIMY